VQYDAHVAPGLIGNFMANWTFGFTDVGVKAALSTGKSFAASAGNDYLQSVPLP